MDLAHLEHLGNVDDPKWYKLVIKFTSPQALALHNYFRERYDFSDYRPAKGGLLGGRFFVDARSGTVWGMRPRPEGHPVDTLRDFLRKQDETLNEAFLNEILVQAKQVTALSDKTLAFRKECLDSIPEFEAAIKKLDSVALFDTLKSDDESAKQRYEESLNLERKIKYLKNVIEFIDKIMPRFSYEVKVVNIMRYAYGNLIVDNRLTELEKALPVFLDNEVMTRLLPHFEKQRQQKVDVCEKYNEVSTRKAPSKIDKKVLADLLHKRVLEAEFPLQLKVKNNERARL